ncbi:hypothetical protein H8356DRAFT_1635170 [Neocallimastix lanati (nom. inval.)]|nr:hypothetical protein H8356DRAFT_1635170 [Neocallimastix sp. JGI-2020a]
MERYEEVKIGRSLRILDYLSEFMEKYDNVNLDLAEIKTNCEVKNFVKISKKYDHIKYFQNMLNSFTEKSPDNKNEISLNNFIKKIVYQDDKLANTVDETDSKNIKNYIDKKKNEHKKIKIKKEITSAIKKNINIMNKTKKVNATTSQDKDKNRKKAVIGRPVRLHFNIDSFNNVKGEIYQFGLRIANKNVETLAEVKNCINRFKANLKYYSYKEIKEIVTLCPVKVLNPKIPFNSYIDIKLNTNSTTIRNGFWLYYFIIFKDDEEMLVSDPFSLMSYKQLHKRRECSFLERHKAYMMNGKESLYPYYFESMFSFDEDTKSYKLKRTFNFGINFYHKKGAEESNNSSRNNLDVKEDNKNYRNDLVMKEDKKIYDNNENYRGSDEVMKDLISLNPTLGDIQLDNVLSTNETLYLDILKQNIIRNEKSKITTNNDINSQNEVNNNGSKNNKINNYLNEYMINNNESNNDELNNDVINDDIINLSRNSLKPKNAYPSPSHSSKSSLLSSPIRIPSVTLSPRSGSIDDFLYYRNLNNNSLTNESLNITKDYFEFKYNLLLREKKIIERFLNEMNEIHKHYEKCFYNNRKTTKDKFYENYLINNLNYIYQKGYEFNQYNIEIEEKIRNIAIKINETGGNTFNAVYNYNQDDTFLPVLNNNEYLKALNEKY